MGYVVVSALFPSGSLDGQGLKDRVKFVSVFVAKGSMLFVEWIWGFEAYLAANPRAAKTWAMMLKVLYDADLAEEEDFLEHYGDGDCDNPGFAASRKAAKPFLEWLAQESDSSDSSDS